MEVATRRRNKFAGKVVEVKRGKSSHSIEFDLVVNEAIGCVYPDRLFERLV